jgi:hypothetical protein
MLTFKVDARYGTEGDIFSQNIIAHTPERASQAAVRFILTKIRGINLSTPVQIIEVREVRG